MKKEKSSKREWGYRLLKPILAPIFYLYYRPKLINKNVIPKRGPIIFAGNHKHILDQCLVIISTNRVVHYMAKKEYFEGPFAWFFKLTGTIRVDREIHDEEAKEQALDVLKSDRALGIFPEGTRNKTDELLLPFKRGCVSFAQKTNATIVPFAIKGEYKFHKSNLRIVFGEPFTVAQDANLQEANEHLRNTIADLLTDEKL